VLGGHVEVLNRILVRLWLAIALVVSQVDAHQHALTHSQEDQQPAGQAPHLKACVKCLAYAEIGAGLNSADSFAVAVDEYTRPPSDMPQRVAANLCFSHAARAPPALS
jgi:hypothetical protein